MRRILHLVLLVCALAAAPHPAVAYGRLFNCSFDAGSDAINERCARVLSEFVEFWMALRDGRWRTWPEPGVAPATTINRIEINGHADGAEATRGLAIVGERRARAVGEWLIAAGIPRECVVVTGHGSRQLLVPTPPHKAEPQNRRVEVVPRQTTPALH